MDSTDGVAREGGQDEATPRRTMKLVVQTVNVFLVDDVGHRLELAFDLGLPTDDLGIEGRTSWLTEVLDMISNQPGGTTGSRRDELTRRTRGPKQRRRDRSVRLGWSLEWVAVGTVDGDVDRCVGCLRRQHQFLLHQGIGLPGMQFGSIDLSYRSDKLVSIHETTRK